MKKNFLGLGYYLYGGRVVEIVEVSCISKRIRAEFHRHNWNNFLKKAERVLADKYGNIVEPGDRVMNLKDGQNIPYKVGKIHSFYPCEVLTADAWRVS